MEKFIVVDTTLLDCGFYHPDHKPQNDYYRTYGLFDTEDDAWEWVKTVRGEIANVVKDNIFVVKINIVNGFVCDPHSPELVF